MSTYESDDGGGSDRYGGSRGPGAPEAGRPDATGPSAQQAGGQGAETRGAGSGGFRPGPGLVIGAVAGASVIVLGLGAAIAGALGAAGASSVLGGLALVLVGAGLLAVLRVPARALVVNAPRLRLARARTRAAKEAQAREGSGGGGSPSSSAAPGIGTDLLVPADPGARELTTLDVVSGPLTTVAASSGAGRWVDEKLAGTTTGETVARLLQLLAGALGFLLLALGLASILGQVIS